MKILFLAPRVPLPADTGGKIRTFNILKQLARHANVHVMTFSFDSEDLKWAEELTKHRMQVTVVPQKKMEPVTAAFHLLINPTPFSIAKYYNPEMDEAVAQMITQEKFDVVHIDHLHMAHYNYALTGLPFVLDEHNVEYKILERCAQVEKNLVKKLGYGVQAGKMKEFETRKIREIRNFLAVSQEDRKILSSLVNERFQGHVIANGVDTEYFKMSEHKLEALVDEWWAQVSKKGEQNQKDEYCIFTGSMDWIPNEDAVIYFSKEILPLVWKAKPKMKFYIVGKNPTESLEKLAKIDSRIVITGRVNDVRPYVARAKVFVVPLRVGGGTRLKILEAMAMEKAVVSTTVGAEGIECTNGKDIIIADQPQEFAGRVVELLNDKPRCQHLGEAAREFVCHNYDWNIIGKKLVNVYEQILKKK